MIRIKEVRTLILAICAIVFLYFIALPVFPSKHPALWHPSAHGSPPTHHERAEVAKDAFRHAWEGYVKYAFSDDALRPLSKSAETTRSGWGASIVDGLSTAIMMDMPDVVNPMLEQIQRTNFAETNSSVSLFGITIRYLGGLLSAHDLLAASSSASPMDPDGKWGKMLLKQAQTLAESLSFAFDTPSGLPQNNLRLLPKPTRKRTPQTDITAAGVLALEFSHLATLSETQLNARPVAALDLILAKSDPKTTPFPGLSGKFLNIAEGRFIDAEGGWYGGAGGFYEYLLKLYILYPSQFGRCLDRWKLAADSSMRYLASSPSSRPDLTFLASYNGTEILYNTDHTAHFAAANFLLGGSVLGEQKYIDFGLKLVDSQIEMYKATATGLGPDKYAWLPNYCHDLHGQIDGFDPMNSKFVPKACHVPAKFANGSSYEKAGFYSTSAAYMLRPEVLESIYYAYRITGEAKYRDSSWDIFQKILEHTQIESGGFAGLKNVNKKPNKIAAAESGGKDGDMEDLQYSYMLAETVKYAWLTQLGDRNVPWHVRADGRNEWVFNTEGHPLRIRK